MTRRFLISLAVLAVVIPAAARADWIEMKPPGMEDMLFAVGRDINGSLYVGGLSMAMSGGFPEMAPVLKRWFDSGQNWQDMGASLGSLFTGAGPVMDLHFIEQWSGWLVMGKTIRYQQALGIWKKVELDQTVQKLHMFDAMRGVACGDGGRIWRTEDGGVTWDGAFDVDSQVNFGALQCFGDGRCFAAGQASEKVEQGQDQDPQTRYKHWEVWSGTNFGKNWQRVHRAEPESENGEVVGPILFLPDKTTGWLVVAGWDMGNARSKQVRLLKTIDGGASFSAVNGFDSQVGVYNNAVFGFKTPITLDMVGVMHWEDASRGLLVGAAYVADEPGGAGGGPPPPIYKRTDFSTTDGGKTWKKPDLGLIEMDLRGGGAIPTSDPRPFAGHFDSWVSGIVVGEKGMVQVWQLDCTKHSDCGKGYLCDRETLVCFPDPDVPGPDACVGCEDAGADRDAVEPADNANLPDGHVAADIRILNDGTEDGGSSGGCAAGGMPGAVPWLPLLAGLGLMRARRRGRDRIRTG